MRQAITTRYLGPTDHRGSRVKASCQALSVTQSWDDALSVDANHLAAAKSLATKLRWLGEWHGAALPDGTGNVYVMTAWPGGDGGTYVEPISFLVTEEDNDA